MGVQNASRVFPFVVVLALACAGFGCPGVEKDAPTAFDYANSSIAIYNPDWNVVPLPNDLLNPVQQTAAGISVPGRSNDAPCEQCVDLRLVDAEEIKKAADKGYEAPPDSALTDWVKRKMSLLNGFAPDIIPEFPFTKPVDMDSIEKYSPGEDANVSSANFFFLDITDAAHPVAIRPEAYLLAFDIAREEEMPYKMTLRRPPISNPLPEHLEQGHTYLVVMTGGAEKGIKDADGVPFQADAPFLLMEGERPYVSPEGSSRMNLLTDIECVRDLEMARQVTNYALEIWENFVAGTRVRDEVISVFYFTIADNPLPRYYNHVPALTFSNPLVPAYADAAEYGTRAPLGFEPSFRLSKRIDADTVNGERVRLYRKLDAGGYERVDVSSIETLNDEKEATIQIHPKDPLEKGSAYLVAGIGDIRGENGLRARPDIYSLLVKTPMTLIETDGWFTRKPASPYIDIRIEALVAMINLQLTDEMDMSQASFNHIPESSLKAATEIYTMLLQQLEAVRADYAEPIQWLIDSGEVANVDDLLLAYTFTMEDDASADGDEDGDEETDGDGEGQANCGLGTVSFQPIAADDLGEKDLATAEITGVFDLYARFEYILLPEPVELFLTGEFTQTGSIPSGDAVIDGYICVNDEAMPLEKAAQVDTDGNFTSFFPDFVIPTTLVDVLEKDAVGDVTMMGTIVNDGGFYGTIEADLRGAKLVDLPEIDVTLDGDFGAKRAAGGEVRR